MLSNFVKMLNRPLGASAPFGSSECHADMGMVAGLGFGMLGSAIDAMSQEDTNYNNRAIAQETNEANERINKSQLAWAREQYEMEKAENRYLVDQAWRRELENRDYQNKYNSPAELAKRLRNAGFNPTLAMYGGGGSVGGGSVSTAASTGQNAHANQPPMIPMQTGAPMQAYRGFGVAAQNAANYVLAVQRQQADISAMRAHTDNETLETVSKVLQRDFQNGKLKAEIGNILDDIRFNRENWDERSRALKVANDKVFADQQYQETMTAYQKLINGFTPKQQEKLLRNLDANYDELMSAAYKNDQEGKRAAADAALAGFEKEQKERLRPWIEQTAQHNADNAYWRSQETAKDFYEGQYEGKLMMGHNPLTGERYEYTRSGRRVYHHNPDLNDYEHYGGGIR